MEKNEIEERLAFALEITRKAGELCMTYFRKSNLAVESKGNGTPVSEADKAAEEFLRNELQKRYPHDAILGEEQGAEGKSNQLWVIDPIDGTESFIRGVPLWGNLLGFESEKQMILGVVNLPGINETLYAGRGLGAWWTHPGTGIDRPVRAQVSRTAKIANAMMCFSGANYWRKAGQLELLDRLNHEFGQTRGWGDCYGPALVATGRADLCIDPIMETWDSAALLPVIQEAGGVFTDFSGKPDIRGRSAISSNGLLHAEALQLVSQIK